MNIHEPQTLPFVSMVTRFIPHRLPWCSVNISISASVGERLWTCDIHGTQIKLTLPENTAGWLRFIVLSACLNVFLATMIIARIFSLYILATTSYMLKFGELAIHLASQF